MKVVQEVSFKDFYIPYAGVETSFYVCFVLWFLHHICASVYVLQINSFIKQPAHTQCTQRTWHFLCDLCSLSRNGDRKSQLRLTYLPYPPLVLSRCRRRRRRRLRLRRALQLVYVCERVTLSEFVSQLYKCVWRRRSTW